MAADGSIIIRTDIDDKDAQKKLSQLTKSIEKMEQTLSGDKAKQNTIKEQLDAAKDAALDTEKTISRMKKELEQTRAITSGQVESTPADYINAAARQKEITEELSKQEAILRSQDKETARIDAQYTRITDKVRQTTASLDAAKISAGEMRASMASAGPASQAMATAMSRVQKSVHRFSLRLREVVRSALIFTAISQALASLREWMGKVIDTNEEAQQAFARLRGALLTFAQPLVNVIIPALTTLVNVLTRIINAASRIVSALFGTTAEQSAEAAENLYNETEALDGVGDAAENAGKSLASFDTINQLSGDSGASSESAAGTTAPDFTSPISDQLSAIVELFTGAALLALGAILTFSGAHIALGISLMVIGALAIWDAVSMNWDAISSMLQGTLGALVAIVSGALLVIGAILAFSGTNIPLGIGLMAAGAVGLAATVAANWNAIVAFIQGPYGMIFGLISGGLLVLGAILTFSGAFIPLGIALMAAGAVGLASAVALNWDSVSTALQGPIGVITAIVSGALLALGAVLAFSGVALPIGLALMAAGAVGLASAVALNWDSVSTALQGPIGVITAIVSGALLALGAVLAFSGVALPIGLALMAAGAIGLATAAAANWDTVVTALQGPIGAVTAIISGALLVIGVILLFTGVGVPLGLGMIVAGVAGLVVAIVPNWNFILDAIGNAWDDFTAWWSEGPSKFFTLEYWLDLGQSMLDGLFNGLASIGQNIAEWGNNFINGVKDFFGIHSPSTEFESLGSYMMDGLEGGVNENSPEVVSAFNTMFSAVRSMCSENVSMMQSDFTSFMTYLMNEFSVSWNNTWENLRNTAYENIQLIISDINSLKASLASIERNITITITTVYKTVGSPSGGVFSSSSTSRSVSTSPFGLSLQDVPALARGAVIPPNREFLAVLGDQTSGTNVEAPLSTIEQAVANVMNRMGYGGDQTVILQVDKDQLGKVVYKLNKAETRRIGVNLAGV